MRLKKGDNEIDSDLFIEFIVFQESNDLNRGIIITVNKNYLYLPKKLFTLKLN